MSVARIELVLRFVGGAVAALGAWDAGRNILVPALPFLSSWTYLTYILLGTSAAVAYVIVFALAPAITTRPFFQIVRWPREGRVAASAGEGQRVLVDTSSIIDGRIADIAQTGFLSGPLVVPRFVLHELQRIADSPDPLRRGRGRRGLDILNRLQKEATVPLEIHEAQGDPNADVDIMLVSLARQLGCPIVTNDYNLNRVAGLQGVKVLNINELANAVKSMVLPGQELSLKIIQEGKELGQGVGYLEDGTMVVVENGRHAIGSDVTVTVSRVLQTVAGRMVFAQQKSGRDGHG